MNANFKIEEIKKILGNWRIPFAFERFIKPQKSPFAIYRIIDFDDVGADDVVYLSEPIIRLNIYIEVPEISVVSKIAEELEKDGFFVEKTIEYDSDSKVFIYTFEF